MSSYKQLRQFTSEELLFNEEETRIVLKFIFKPVDHPFIDSLQMSDHLRSFAQGLLVEAIDASYAVGYVKGLFESTVNPTKGAMKVIKSFGRKAASHWFKNASAHDLKNAKIYDFIRDYIAVVFKLRLGDFLAGIKLENRSGAFFAYQLPSQSITKRWG